MQCAKDDFRQYLADSGNTRKLLDSCLLHTLQAAEMVKQGPAASRADARDFFQPRSRGRFLPLPTVTSDSKTVGFVADLLDQV